MNPLLQEMWNEVFRDRPPSTFSWPFTEAAWSHIRETKQPLLLCGYGSLMYSKSAGKTLSKAAQATARPIICFGMDRRFNRMCKERDHVMLNASSTSSLDDNFNGVCFSISKKQDLIALNYRESHYDMIETLGCDFDDWMTTCSAKREGKTASPSQREVASMAKEHFFPVFVLQTRDPSYLSSILFYHPSYYRLVRRGAREWGRDFLSYYRDTTKQSDGSTLIPRR